MKKKVRLLKLEIMGVFLVLITLFSVMKVQASSFAYNDFDWNKFYNENIAYWTDYCGTNASNLSHEECIEIVLSGKKEFYIKLYKLLAKYEKSGYKLDDNIILATAFFDLTPDTFTEIPEDYQEMYTDGSAYNIDLEENVDSYDINSDEEIEYYQKEKDSLKTLIKHMLSYTATCSGEVAKPSVDENGNKVCNQGSLSGDSCVGTIKTYDLYYSEYLANKVGFFGKLLGLADENKQDCLEKNHGTNYSVSGTKKINYDMYWNFLINSNYFDTKKHLESRYRKVLDNTNYKTMTELMKDEKAYEAQKDELIKIREQIVGEIQSILEDYEDYFADTPDSFVNSGCSLGNIWWPIGSAEVSEENGLLFAKGDPSTVKINSSFGQRNDPFSGKKTTHAGVDIAGISNETNVIAAKDGVVVYPTPGSPTNCPSSSSLDSCGGGYGNYVVIQHNDGSYTLYGHMYANSITVSAQDSVSQGQVIGKVGSSGKSTGAHLHFEVRQGSNSSASAIDPITVVSPDNPRPASAVCNNSSVSGDFLTFLHSWENGGTAPERNGNYVVHDDGAGNPTVGFGVALRYNIERFKNKGIDVSGMGVGSEISKTIVDEVEMEKLNESFNNVRNKLGENGITLAEYQLESLVSRYYNCGNINNFPKNYLQYGDTDALYDNYMRNPVTAGGVYLSGLERRRKAEWQLFHYHNYQLNT